MHAPPRPDYPILLPNDLVNFDAFLFGIPTRYGNFPAQWKAFWDATGSLWMQGALAGKMCSVFVSTGTPGGGQESTVLNALSTFVHHGMMYIPLGYKNTFAQMSNLSEVRGGTYFCSDFLEYVLIIIFGGSYRIALGCRYIYWWRWVPSALGARARGCNDPREKLLGDRFQI